MSKQEAIDAAYLIPPGTAQFVCCNFPNLVNTVDMIRMLAPGGTFLLNSPVPAEELWDTLPAQVQEGVLEKGVTMYAINAMKVARDAGMGRRVNTVMQVRRKPPQKQQDTLFRRQTTTRTRAR